ncbi:hypothetical protein ACQEVG_32710 [Streptomyces sp. CA-135486]|uniref:hypothetical protein n=1 Tax=Streptomyces sp. CA-135486 TaxID=3240049 RepID=UPI003D915341
MTLKRPIADAVQRATERAVEQRSAAWQLATVTAVYTDGTVDISTATGPIARVRRLRSYAGPVVGDVVQVDRTPGGNWLVVGTLATGGGWQPLTLSAGFSVVGGAADGVPSVRVTDDGMLHLSGLVKGVVPVTTLTQFATLPTGVTTTLNIRGPVVTSHNALANVTVLPSGAVSVYSSIAHVAATWFQLDAVRGRPQ